MSFPNIAAGLAAAGGVLQALNGLVPLIGEAVESAESLFPNAKAGAEKLAWVQSFVKGFLTKAGQAVSDVENLAPTFETLINAIVAAAKVAPTAAAPAPAATPTA